MITKTQPNEIREQQRAAWNKFSSGWKKWDQLVMRFLKPVGDAIIDSVQWKEDYIVLDIATGTGEPGLTAATLVRKGKVYATDLAEDMVTIAAENAKKRGLKNFETRICSVEELPFDDNYFDVVICRFGFMFFPDMQAATNEIHRVLKPGGKVVTSVWSVPEKNSWATLIMNTIKKYVDIPAPSPDTPGLFRCAKPGFVKELFQQAGFNNTSEEELTYEAVMESPEIFWEYNSEVAQPVVAGLSKADDATREKIRNEVIAEARRDVKNGKLTFYPTATIIRAEK